MDACIRAATLLKLRCVRSTDFAPFERAIARLMTPSECRVSSVWMSASALTTCASSRLSGAGLLALVDGMQQQLWWVSIFG